MTPTLFEDGVETLIYMSIYSFPESGTGAPMYALVWVEKPVTGSPPATGLVGVRVMIANPPGGG